jgi:hypothetical protein
MARIKQGQPCAYLGPIAHIFRTNAAGGLKNRAQRVI